jgi:hypothetical protein
MAKFNSLSELIDYTLSGKRVEPEKRIKEIHHVPRGLRHKPTFPRHIVHTYEIRGGITVASLVAENIMKNNVLLKKLKHFSSSQ